MPSLACADQRQQLDALKQLNELHREAHADDSRLAARIESFELAYRMQINAPEAFDVERESAETHALYGVGDAGRPTSSAGNACWPGGWSSAASGSCRSITRKRRSAAVASFGISTAILRTELPNNCLATDQPIAALLKDLKARGMLDDTLVVWGGEFGRTPTAEGTDGREHHPFGFTMWLAGGGIKGGMTHGATDEFGWHAVQDKVHVHDLHATILHLMGLDHTKLTYRYAGRNFRLTDVYGEVVTPILA